MVKAIKRIPILRDNKVQVHLFNVDLALHCTLQRQL